MRFFAIFIFDYQSLISSMFTMGFINFSFIFDYPFFTLKTGNSIRLQYQILQTGSGHEMEKKFLRPSAIRIIVRQMSNSVCVQSVPASNFP
jgi:hypothetical protein